MGPWSGTRSYKPMPSQVHAIFYLAQDKIGIRGHRGESFKGCGRELFIERGTIYVHITVHVPTIIAIDPSLVNDIPLSYNVEPVTPHMGRWRHQAGR